MVARRSFHFGKAEGLFQGAYSTRQDQWNHRAVVVKFQHCPYGKSGGRIGLTQLQNYEHVSIKSLIVKRLFFHDLYSQLNQLHPPKTNMDTQNDGLEKLVPVEWVGHF